MTTKSTYTTNHVTPPGRILAAELKERGITRSAFSRATHLSPMVLSALLKGAGNLTPEIAAILAAELGIPADLWLGLERRYREALDRAAAVA
ncbi:MAG: helix-turn-helix domain-containing protein [Dehalococcoidia bacterium]|nr:helix-turn-helix domain-containing protein [Dehalococcoidia bacterium]